MKQKIAATGKRTHLLGRLLPAAMILCLCCVMTALLSGGAPAYASEAQPVLRLGSQAVYAPVQYETVVTIPIIAGGDVDLRSYDFTVSYDTRSLSYIQGSAEINAFEVCQEIGETDGSVRFTGAAREEAPDHADGQIGQISFLLNRDIKKDATVKLSLNVTELGEETDAGQMAVAGSTVQFLMEEPTPVYCGDVDQNGSVTSDDALAILKYVVKLPGVITGDDKTVLAVADADGDGQITSNDALMALKVCVKLSDAVRYDPARDLEQEPVQNVPAFSEDRPDTKGIGDVNGDGKVTARDARIVLAACENGTADETLLQAGDVNGDGILTETDSRMILQFAGEILDYVPAMPFTASGHIWIVGDSMASPHDTPDYQVPIIGWGEYLPDYLTEAASVHNEARSGRSAKSYLNEKNYTTVIENMKYGDYLIFAMGNNDSHANDTNLYTDPYGGSEDEGSYMWYMKNYYLDIALRRGVKVILVASDKTDWAAATHRMSEEYEALGYEVPCIDITEIEQNVLAAETLARFGENATEEQRAQVWADLHGIDEKGEANIHYSYYGANLIAQEFAQKFKSLESQISGFVK